MKVLVPLDGAELLDTAVPAVKRLLGAVPGADLHLLRVLDPRRVQGKAASELDLAGPIAVGSRGPTVAAPLPRVVETHGEAMERLHWEAYEWLQAVAATQFPDERIETSAMWSRKPAEKIIEVAETTGADVIVMATHGRAGIAHFINGSVTEEVIRLSGRPVLVVGPAFVPA